VSVVPVAGIWNALLVRNKKKQVNERNQRSRIVSILYKLVHKKSSISSVFP
jgi:hypothetical protein